MEHLKGCGFGREAPPPGPCGREERAKPKGAKKHKQHKRRTSKKGGDGGRCFSCSGTGHQNSVVSSIIFDNAADRVEMWSISGASKWNEHESAASTAVGKLERGSRDAAVL